MKLFKIQDHKLTISEEAFLLKPFSTLYKRDRSEQKLKALKELAFVYFMCDPRSDFYYITDVEERQAKIINDLELTKWKPDSKVKEAMDYYSSFKTAGANLLDTALYGVNKLKEAIKNIDLEDRDKNERPIYKLSEYTKTLKEITPLVDMLVNAEKRVSQELEQVNTARGNIDKSILDDEF